MEVLLAIDSADPGPSTSTAGALEAATQQRLDEFIADALTVPDAAALLGVPEQDVLDAIAARELYAVPGPDRPLVLRAQLTVDGSAAAPG